MSLLLTTCHCLLMVLAGWAQASEPAQAFTPKEIADWVSPSVVLIEVEKKGEEHLGSGFVASADGLIVTNLHVLDGATSLKVSLPDGRKFQEISIFAFDIEQDIAVIQVEIPSELGELPAAYLGDPSAVQPGDAILVISNPFGLELTITEGIVSAWRQPGDAMTSNTDHEPARLPLPARRLIQISAAISPGSSGGPLLNERAEVIGIAVAGVLYGMAGINFAVPTDIIPAMVDDGELMDLPTFQDRVNSIRYDLARPHFEQADLSFEQDQLQAAMHHLQRALLLFPDYGEALVLMGRVRMGAGDLEGAEEMFVKAVEANEESAEGWYGLGALWTRVASIRNSDPMLERAMSAYEKCLEVDEWHAGATYDLALIHMQRGNLTTAEGLLTRAVEINDEMADAYILLGEIYFSRDDLDEAKDAFERAAWIDSEHPLAIFGLARVNTANGNLQDASRNWSKFLDLSEGVLSLRREREIALRVIERHFPALVRRP